MCLCLCRVWTRADRPAGHRREPVVADRTQIWVPCRSSSSRALPLSVSVCISVSVSVSLSFFLSGLPRASAARSGGQRRWLAVFAARWRSRHSDSCGAIARAACSPSRASTTFGVRTIPSTRSAATRRRPRAADRPADARVRVSARR